MKKQNATLDLTKGPIISLMLRFCLPILLGNLMQQFYNMVDSAIVGQFVGTNALAAVGATGSITFLVIGFVDGMCAGFCIPVAQAFGAGNESLLKRCVWNIIYLAAASSIVLMTVTSLCLGSMLNAMNFPEDIYADSFIYLRVIFLGIPATIAYNTQAGLMRAMGNSRAPLMILIASSIVNVVLDLLLVRVFGLGVFGAALATIISQIASSVACFVYIRKNFSFLSQTDGGERKFSFAISKRLVFSGLPMALQYSITAIGSVLIQTAVNGFGSLVVASVTAANKVQSFVHLPFSTLGVTLSTWCGQNIGASDYDRVRRGFWAGMVIATVYSIAMGVFMYFCGEYISLIFIDSDEPRLVELLAYVREFLRKNCVYYIPLGVLTVCRFSLQGLEYGFTAMFAGVFEMVARSVMALWAVGYFGFNAICYANPAAWFAACLLLVPACLVIFPKIKRRTAQANENNKIKQNGD
ncbi:MAG: MATE family efflux transporter [Eubacteriales bacterium]